MLTDKCYQYFHCLALCWHFAHKTLFITGRVQIKAFSLSRFRSLSLSLCLSLSHTLSLLSHPLSSFKFLSHIIIDGVTYLSKQQRQVETDRDRPNACRDLTAYGNRHRPEWVLPIRPDGDCRDEPTDDVIMWMTSPQFYNEDVSLYFSFPFFSFFFCFFCVCVCVFFFCFY